MFRLIDHQAELPGRLEVEHHLAQFRRRADPCRRGVRAVVQPRQLQNGPSTSRPGEEGARRGRSARRSASAAGTPAWSQPPEREGLRRVQQHLLATFIPMSNSWPTTLSRPASPRPCCIGKYQLHPGLKRAGRCSAAYRTDLAPVDKALLYRHRRECTSIRRSKALPGPLRVMLPSRS